MPPDEPLTQPNPASAPSTPSPEPSPSAPEATPSLRDTIEGAYEEIETADRSATGEEGDGQGDRPRDNLGRFVAKPGEQSPPAQPADPAQKPIDGSQPKTPEPAAAPAAPSIPQPPDSWSAEDKATFAKLPQEGQAFLLKRYNEMEADYTRKTQAAAGAVNFANAMAPVFNDPVISANLRERQVHPVNMLHEWAGYQRRGLDQDPRVRIGVLAELAERMGFDPAILFMGGATQPQPGGFSEEELKHPAVKRIADEFARSRQELSALKASIEAQARQDGERQQAAAYEQAMGGIEAFAAAKDAAGNLLHPHFDHPEVISVILDLYRANPKRDLAEAYNLAVGASPALRQGIIDAEIARVRKAAEADRARAAVRGNTRGITSPVAKPTPLNGGAPGSLRDVIESAASEVGLVK